MPYRHAVLLLAVPFASGCAALRPCGGGCLDSAVNGALTIYIDHDEQPGAYRYELLLSPDDLDADGPSQGQLITCKVTAPAEGRSPDCSVNGDKGLTAETDAGGLHRVSTWAESGSPDVQLTVTRDGEPLFDGLVELTWRGTKNECDCDVVGEAASWVAF